MCLCVGARERWSESERAKIGGEDAFNQYIMRATRQSSKNSLVKHQETLQNLNLMFVRNSPPDLVVQLFVREELNGLKALVG